MHISPFEQNPKFIFPLTIACVIAGLLVLALDFTYPLLIGSGVLYVALLAIAINSRSAFTLWFLTIVYLILHFIGYYIFTEEIFIIGNTLLRGEETTAMMSIPSAYMLSIRTIGGIAIIFTSLMGYVLLKKSEIVEEKQRQVAIIDYLTGAYSRRFLFENLKQRFSDCQRFPTYNFSAIILDIDKFKPINDSLGHLAGDVALRSLVDCIKGVIRTVDIVGRYGGEEFVVISPNSNIEGAEQLAERLRVAVESLLVVHNGKKIPLTISLGVADYRTNNYISIEEMLEAADGALYIAKNNGRNQVQVAAVQK